MNYLLCFVAFVAYFSWRSHLHSKSMRRRLLRLLAFAERPMDGMSLKPLLDISYGLLYAMLDDLVNKGLVGSEMGESEDNARTRRFYRLTAAGYSAAQESRWE